MMTSSIRRLSTRVPIDKWFNVLQSSLKDEQPATLVNFVKTSLQKKETSSPNFVNDVIHRWAIEQPTAEALWTYDTNNNNQCQKLSYSDIYVQSSRLANVLTSSKEFNLTAGKTVLVILPNEMKERMILQLACLQSGLIYCPYDSKDLTDIGIPQRIQKLSVDCVITHQDNIEIVRKYTHNPLRPLKKGLITNCSTSEPLPVGWNHLMLSADNAESKYTKINNIESTTPVIRFLSNNNQVIEYSHENFAIRLLLTAFWFNANKKSRLTWMKNQNEIISFAPWLFGSSILYKQTQNLQTMLNTFDNHPIDTFCASPIDYEMLGRQQEKNTHLKQLFSTEPIDPVIKARWYSLTNLHIRDDYADLDSKSKFIKQNRRLDDDRLEAYSTEKIPLVKPIPSSNIPFNKFIYNYPTIQNQRPHKYK